MADEAQQEPKADDAAATTQQEEPKKEEIDTADTVKKEVSDDKKEDNKPEKKEDVKEEEKEEDKEEQKEEDKGSRPEYELFYWQGFGGRATVIRLCLALCELKWREAFKGKDKASIDKEGALIKGADITGFPNFAYPIIRHNKEREIVISQTAVICSYILNENGYEVIDSLDKLYSLQIALTIWDAWSDWAGKLNKAIGFDKWITSRIGSYLDVFEAQLKRNNHGKGWFFGDKVSIADVFLVDFMRRYRKDKEQHYNANPYKLLKELVNRFEELPQIKKYIESDEYKSICNLKSRFIGI